MRTTKHINKTKYIRKNEERRKGKIDIKKKNGRK